MTDAARPAFDPQTVAAGSSMIDAPPSTLPTPPPQSTSRGPRRSAGSTAGLLALWLVPVVAAALASSTPGLMTVADRDTKEVPLTIDVGSTPWTALQPGDCFTGGVNVVPDGDEPPTGGWLNLVTVVRTSCAQDHEGEVFARFVVTPEPGDELIPNRVVERCREEFEEFVDAEWTEIDVDVLSSTLAPGSDAVRGERTCSAVAPPGTTMRGSVAGRGPDAGFVHPTALSVGDCFDLPEYEWSYGVLATPCTEDHWGEVFAVFDLPGGRFPGAQSAVEFVDDRCDDLLGDADGPAGSEGYYYLTPTEFSWQVGDPTVCWFAAGSDQLLEGRSDEE